jgi:hypothetical protein
MKDLRTLLNSLDPEADLARRHVWLIQLFEWIRGDESSVQACASRLQTFILAVQTQPELEARLKAWWQTLVQTVEVTTLLADFGFAPRTAFFSELADDCAANCCPAHPKPLTPPSCFRWSHRRVLMRSGWRRCRKHKSISWRLCCRQIHRPTGCAGSFA